MLLPRFVKLSRKDPVSRKCIGVTAPFSFWLWLSSKSRVGFVKTLNELFFLRFCSSTLTDDSQMEDKICRLCKEVAYTDSEILVRW